MRRRATAALTFLFGFAMTRPSLAFCRTSVCELGAGTRCTPERAEDCGLPLRWKEPCIGFSVQRDGSRLFSTELLAELVTRAFDTWGNAECDGGHPRFLVKRQADAVCAVPEYNVDFNGNKGNANVVMFRDDDWPYPDFDFGLALTTLSYYVDTGEILDADIEINTFGVEFSTSDADVTYDLLAVLQHETGHFLGIAHATDMDATMQEVPSYGTLTRRTLEADDEAAVCAVYPPEEPALEDSCSPAPHDFSPNCNRTLRRATAQEPSAGCSTPRAPARPGVPLVLSAVSLGAWALRRRWPPTSGDA